MYTKNNFNKTCFALNNARNNVSIKFTRISAASFMCAGFTYGFENVVVLTFCIVKCCIVGLNCLVKRCVVVLYNKEPEMIGCNDAVSRLLHYMKDRELSRFKFKDIKLVYYLL